MTQSIVRLAACAAAAFAGCSTALADDSDDAPLRIEGSPFISFARQPPGDAPAPKTPQKFGEEGSQWWTVGAGVAATKGDVDLNIPRVAFSEFLAPDVEWSIELNAWYFSQKGKDQVGINPAMVFRWHFLNTGDWTLYADAGIGILYASGDVPTGGTRLDFTPKVGVGFTKQISESGARFQAGLRWHHISNARIQDDANNPARDAPMIYFGVEWPF